MFARLCVFLLLFFTLVILLIECYVAFVMFDNNQIHKIVYNIYLSLSSLFLLHLSKLLVSQFIVNVLQILHNYFTLTASFSLLR